jgi:hypothetical protein
MCVIVQLQSALYIEYMFITYLYSRFHLPRSSDHQLSPSNWKPNTDCMHPPRGFWHCSEDPILSGVVSSSIHKFVRSPCCWRFVGKWNVRGWGGLQGHVYIELRGSQYVFQNMNRKQTETCAQHGDVTTLFSLRKGKQAKHGSGPQSYLAQLCLAGPPALDVYMSSHADKRKCNYIRNIMKDVFLWIFRDC